MVHPTENQLSLTKQLLQAFTNAILASLYTVDEDDWSLNGDQAFFMVIHNNLIEAAFAGERDENENTEILRELVASNVYNSLFGDMSFDEAHDRYMTMLEEGRA